MNYYSAFASFYAELSSFSDQFKYFVDIPEVAKIKKELDDHVQLNMGKLKKATEWAQSQKLGEIEDLKRLELVSKGRLN